MKSTIHFTIALMLTLGACAQTPSSEIKIIRPDEKGIPFTYTIQVLDRDTKQPVAGAEVYTYQTNHLGDYESNQPESARISGTLKTDKEGKGKVITIFPRGYNNSSTGEHIHYRVSAPGYTTSKPTLDFQDFYQKQYDHTRLQTNKAYLMEMTENAGKRTGTVKLYISKS